MKMKPSFCCLVFLLYLIFSSTHCCCAATCQSSDRSALLQFKNSFVADPDCSGSLPMVATWGDEGGTDDCCSWDGVKCSNQTGNVVGINLAGGCLYGSIDSNNSLFRLVHLQTLILSDSNFNFSKIPSGVGQLSDLKQLDLGNSGFFGQIPSAISRLSKLETLRLSRVNLSSVVPEFLANMSSLVSLSLGDCELSGNFPQKIFHLPNLQHLVLPFNPNLSGTFPEFNFNSSLQRIWVEQSAFHGEIPSSIENLKSLTDLKLGNCSFSGIVPDSLGNITGLQELELHLNNFSGRIPLSLGRLTELNRLFLSYNKFSNTTLSWVGKQNKLVFLGLSRIGLSGALMPSLRHLTNIAMLLLGENELTGEIPFWIGNFAQLADLHLYENKLSGSIPKSFSQLTNLKHLYLQYNHLNGTVELSMFLKLKSLTELHLTANNLTVLDNQVSSLNVTLPKFKFLGLGSCNLTQIPTFLENQNELDFLELGQNNIQGQIPKWMWSMSRESLKVLNLSHNALTDVEEPRDDLAWVNLSVLDLSNNRLRKSFPILPAICKLSSLVTLDLSSNLMRGMLPQCIGNFSSLEVMNFRQNLLHGTIPDSFRSGSKLRSLVFSQNQLEGQVPRSFIGESNLRAIDFRQKQFQGQVPRSLANCQMLEDIDLSHNQLTDVFPSWLGALPELRLLMLQCNQFYGIIEKPKFEDDFPRLHIIDLSDNNFSGNLPLKSISNWNAMKITNPTTKSTYMTAKNEILFDYAYVFSGSLEYYYSITIINKGYERRFSKIQETFTSMDFSSNRFEGEILDQIGELKGLHSLNLSHNVLSGQIPPSLGNITQLESLDLSNNKLSGKIPETLAQLTFLAIFNVSQNNLSGLIPEGNQLSNIERSSYEGNVGLCGKPLGKKCGESEAKEPFSSTSGDDDEGEEASMLNFGWKMVLIGYCCGVVYGMVAGNYVTKRKEAWFLRIYRVA